MSKSFAVLAREAFAEWATRTWFGSRRTEWRVVRSDGSYFGRFNEEQTNAFLAGAEWARDHASADVEASA